MEKQRVGEREKTEKKTNNNNKDINEKKSVKRHHAVAHPTSKDTQR